MLETSIDIKEILQLLPYRYPFLLIDGVIELIHNRFIKAFKNITANEIFFQGHFPKNYIFPGVLILESMAQTAYLLKLKSMFPVQKNSFFYLARINNVRFRGQVRPGDQIILEIYFEKIYKSIVKFRSLGIINQKIICEANMTCFQK